eukprot:jgi/Psemu1/18834/gm1.18834_g
MSVNVVFKEEDPEILYPIYKIKEQVRYAARGQFPAQIEEVSRYMFQKFMNYNECPGYDILSKYVRGIRFAYASSSEERKDKDSTSSYNPSYSEEDDEDDALV